MRHRRRTRSAGFRQNEVECDRSSESRSARLYRLVCATRDGQRYSPSEFRATSKMLLVSLQPEPSNQQEEIRCAGSHTVTVTRWQARAAFDLPGGKRLGLHGPRPGLHRTPPSTAPADRPGKLLRASGMGRTGASSVV
jgi:hypothetical protein